jgi:hypothetical protein
MFRSFDHHQGYIMLIQFLLLYSVLAYSGMWPSVICIQFCCAHFSIGVSYVQPSLFWAVQMAVRN